jgi:hypothetical protein
MRLFWLGTGYRNDIPRQKVPAQTSPKELRVEHSFSTIIGIYKGLDNVGLIIRAVRAMNPPPKEIFLWFNTEPGKVVNIKGSGSDLTVIHAQKNLGCFARFSAVPLCDTPYVMLLDDDTVPGPQWSINCFETFDRNGDCILGTRGIVLNEKAYWPHQVVGVGKNNKESIECDLVGHNWFFPRHCVVHLLKEIPLTRETGEDIQFSACASMAGIRTFCPPHPDDQTVRWGSLRRDLNFAPGRISTGQSTEEHFRKRGEVVRHWIQRGWKPLFMQ